MTREEIIAHLDTEINLLLRARDILASPLAGFMKVVPRKTKARSAAKVRVEQPVAATPVEVPAPPPPVAVEPQVQRVPPRRRMERRQSPDKQAKSSAALTGHVPAGPVAVSAVEARKLQDRPVVVAVAPAAVELRPEPVAERSLGSLIQAFERRSGLNGLEIP
jgi:hypothetical protein